MHYKKFTLKKVFLSLFFLCSATFSTFAEESLYSNDNTLKVGFLIDMPYLMSRNEYTGYMYGYGYDYLQMISNFTGWKYEYVFGEWNTLWSQFLRGEIDILEDVSYTPERASQMLFPDIPMGNENYKLYVYNKKSDITVENLKESLKGKKVGITAGTIQYEIFLDWMKKHDIDCEAIPFYSDFERNDQFANGQIDAVVELEASSVSTWEPIIEIGSTEYYMALSKGNERHLKELNSALIKLDSVDPNYNNALYYKYYSRAIVSSRLSLAEKNYLSSTKKLRCGYFDDLISNSKDNPGLYKNVIEEMLKSLNIEGLSVEYVYYPTYDALTEALQKNQIDVAYPVLNNTGASETGNYSVITDITTMPVSLVTNKKRNLKGINFIGIPGNGIGVFHAKSNFPTGVVVNFSNLNQLLDQVASGDLDAALLPERLINDKVLSHQRYANLQVVQFKTPYTTSIAIKRGNTGLYQLLKRSVSLMDSDFINEAVAANTKYEVDYSFKTFIANHTVLFILTLIFISAILIVMIFIAYKRHILQQNYDSERSLRNELAQALKITEEHQKKERELLYLSETDKLTGIANRGAEGKIKQFMEIGTFGMFCLFDVDKFKSINDNYGHLTGDKVLISIADCMKRVFRETDIILRLGGDEFAAYTIGITDKEIATNLINRFFNEIDRIEIPELKGSKITISLGATFILTDDDLDFETVYKRADKGCYISKRETGNYFTFIEK